MKRLQFTLKSMDTPKGYRVPNKALNDYKIAGKYGKALDALVKKIA